MEPNFLDNLASNSLDRVELIMILEEAFGRDIPVRVEEELGKLRTVREAIDYLEGKKGGNLH